MGKFTYGKMNHPRPQRTHDFKGALAQQIRHSPSRPNVHVLVSKLNANGDIATLQARS
jgi:hypothetical protein